MEILIATLWLTLLMVSECASVTRVVDLIPNTTFFHDTRAACVQNNHPFTFPAASVTVIQVVSDNGVGTQDVPYINDGTAPATIGGLHNMGADVLASYYSVQNLTCANIYHEKSFQGNNTK